jgi:putative ABC transport system substrate-binding protein
MLRREVIALLGGAPAIWPLAVRAQQQAMPVIGYLSVGSPETDNIPARLIAFRRGLGEAGYIEDQNIAVEYRRAKGQYDRLPDLASDLVRRQVAVIVAQNVPTAFAAKAATATIPIVFILGIDPVQSGLTASLNRPGGNITGVTILSAELTGKRLELLHEMVPTAAVVAVLVNPNNPVTESETGSLQDAARALGLQMRVLRASTVAEIDEAFGNLVGLRAGALVVSGDSFFTSARARIVALAARHAVPTIYYWRGYTAEGGLMSYGTDFADGYRLVGVYTGKILKGAKPADLPVQQAVKIELVINLKTANALGLTIPPHLLARADEVIE